MSAFNPAAHAPHLAKPAHKPKNPNFSSGPCAKPPGWSIDWLKDAFTGRSHRAAEGKARLKQVITETARLLALPEGFRVAITAGSDTGAIEMAMWSLLGPRPVDVLAFDVFSNDWVTDVVKQLKLPNAHVYTAPFGALPDLSNVHPAHDLVFTWNGTTSGVRVPNGDFIANDREGLVLCDATSAIFAMELPWDKLDAVTFSWQKVLGGEAAHGVLILSPRAIKRLETHTPSWPMPKIFRLTKGGKVNDGVFAGETINTPSMLCVEDARKSLQWLESIGGVKGCVARASANAQLLYDWVETVPWLEPLAQDPATRTTTSVCLRYSAPEIQALPEERQKEFAKSVATLLEKEGAVLDANHYRDAPAGLRFWCGATVERDDLRAALPWVEWAYATAFAEWQAKQAA